MTLKIGSLFAGMGGLDIAVEMVFPGAEVAWVSEFDKAPSKILAHRYPEAPNHGDVTKIDWTQVEPVDVITGGSPCQDLSHAGKRAGMKAGTRSGLWASMCDAIDIIRPSLVLWENVRGALSAEATAGDVESCEFCVGDDGRPSLRALGRVLGDLAELGYDAAWCGLRAADVGAPHGRFRIFVLAWPATDAGGEAWEQRARLCADDAARNGRRLTTRGSRPPGGSTLIWGSPEWRELNLLPTPTASDSNGSGGAVGSSNVTLTDATERADTRSIDFGQYAPAIARWEALTRPAPAPTEPTGKGGAHRLAPRFVEWLMGLPDGWVTDPAIGISRNDQLKALGNGVVPQQAAAAITHLLTTRAAVV